ncbi:glutaminyl-peptide cyclotransferase [Nilaparvata lugens]|uniref:glutaminyl-peptide cyclotransferase n=1 Tax=Nilaparvata lugens TaxID=108931 RepID=UPI00193E6E81|nr:glutaminyl-peptide cyclotransferase [Nilaparvata lugens]
MLIFFDGEEAFKEWGPRDSIYGARHLASKWKDTHNPLGNGSQMDSVDVMMLLDLLGAPNPTFYDYYGFSTTQYFRKLCDIEDSLHELSQLSQYSPTERYFMRLTSRSHIEDDHLPFIKNEVPILHVIASPFPEVWHKMEDNYSALDFATIDNLNKIFRVFTMSYLNGSENQKEQRNLDF